MAHRVAANARRRAWPVFAAYDTTYVRRWHLYRQTVGTGHLYQGTYKSFPIQNDDHFLTVCRYVEQNPLRRVW
jgi:hypothetical protein